MIGCDDRLWNNLYCVEWILISATISLVSLCLISANCVPVLEKIWYSLPGIRWTLDEVLSYCNHSFNSTTLYSRHCFHWHSQYMARKGNCVLLFLRHCNELLYLWLVKETDSVCGLVSLIISLFQPNLQQISFSGLTCPDLLGSLQRSVLLTEGGEGNLFLLKLSSAYATDCYCLNMLVTCVIL